MKSKAELLCPGRNWLLALLMASLLLVGRWGRGAEWQWSTFVPPPAESKERPRAFLWIPPTCDRVRGVVFGHHNMQEEPILEHPMFRQALEEIGFAEIWVAPTFDRNFRFDQGAGQRFDAMMARLAEESGYSELTNVPVVPVGHSAAASLPWYFAAWKPERTLACVSFSGQWPYVPDPQNAPQVAGLSVDSVPGLVTMGEYEWADDNMPKGLKTRAEHPLLPLSALGCPADGHFASLDEKVEFLALYLKKAAQYRLPKPESGKAAFMLNPINPAKSGWLVDRYRKGQDPMAPAAPVGQYKGDSAQAFWFFDGEIAAAAEAFQKRHRGKPALLGYVQEGKVLPQRPGLHAQVAIKFLPGEDGVTFKLAGAFLDTVPAGRPARWAEKREGDSIEMPTGGLPIELLRITGPVQKLSEDTWTLAFNRASFLGDRRGNEAWLVAVWPGNATFKRAVQQAVLQVPARNSDGLAQKITFDAPARLRPGDGPIQLLATSDCKLPVRFFVREGPAEVESNVLKLTAIPRRAAYPIKITVVAWQWGRTAEPKIQTADPVERTLLIEK